MQASLIILGGASLVGVAVTYLFTRETTGRSLEENEKEDEYAGVWFIRLFLHNNTASASSRLSVGEHEDMSSRSTANSIRSSTPIH